MALVKAQPNPETRLNIPEEPGYVRVPYAFCKETRRISDCLVRSMIYSFSCVKGKPDARCEMSYSRFQDKLHYSRSTVNAAIRGAIEDGGFDQDKTCRLRASYKYLPATDAGDAGEGSAQTLPSFTVEFYLLHTGFSGKDGKVSYLPKSAAMVLGLIKTHHDNGGFTGSTRSIARTLGLSPKTIKKAIDLLLQLELIFRPKEGRGVNGWRRSSYIPNGKALRKAERTFNKSLRGSASKTRKSPEDLLIERERYYARLQNAERERVSSIEHELNADSRFFELDRRRRQLEVEKAKAEVYSPLRLPGIEKELAKVRIDRARRMAQLGVAEEDLMPKFLCAKCEDTGYMKDSGVVCDCFRRRRHT